MNESDKRIAGLSPAKLKLLQRRKVKNKTGVECNVIKRRIQPGPALLSFAQQRLWFLNQLELDSAVYNTPMGLRLVGVLNVPALHSGLSEVLRRHESLRSRFEVVEGQPVEVIQCAASLEMPIIDLRVLPKREREANARELCIQESQRPFDLARDLLLRARLFRLDETDHILLLTVHHIASDGWSMGLLVRELRTLYEAFVEGKPSPLPELTLQYADFAAWQREWLQGEVLERQLSYWRKQLEGAPALLELPTDRPRPSTQSYRGALMPWEFPKPLSVALRELSRREGATFFMILLAAFQTLLHRYTGGEDVLVGSPIAGRNRTEIEPLIGFFINTLVLRGNLSGNPSFRVLLGRTREAAFGAYAHQDLPFERLVEQLHPERDLSHSPLFQVMLILQNAPWETPQLAGLEVTSMRIDSGTSKFDLTLNLRERGGVLQGVVEYNTDLFEAETIQRMLCHYQTLLEGIVSNPDQRLSDLPLLTSAERHQLLVEWNGTEIEYPKDRRLHELIEEQARRTPEVVAIVFEDQQLTYRQLNERANQLARYLQRFGVGPDTLVGICVERSLEMVVGLLGILKAGGAYVPLDPIYPKERLAFMLEDSGMKVLLTQASLTESLPAHRAQIFRLDADWLEIAMESSSNVGGPGAAYHLAYMIYTSGSTGKPKAVQIQHSAVVNLLHSMRKVPGLTAQDRLLAITSLSFDIAGLELWLPLVVGAQIVIASREQARDGQALAELLARCDATVMQAAPSLWKMLLSGDWRGSPHLKILCGGEQWPRELARQLLPKCGSLWNMYGPTETTIWSAALRVNPDEEVLIGGPVCNTQLYVLDGHLQLAPVGVSGELHIGGDGLAMGYFKMPDLTNERFVHDPFVNKAGARMYKTGDLVRWQADGKIKFMGRTDHQVKIRGFRIELGEIESALTAHPGVREAVVVALGDDPGNRRLVAYLSAKAGEPPKASELRSLLQTKLPEYMIPSAFVTLNALPLTPGGKVDRNALPKPDFQPSADKFALPNTPTEITLAKIWSEVLGVNQIGLHDNFFELGGHSLQAIRLLATVHKLFSKALPVSSIFNAPTILQFSRLLDENADRAVAGLSDRMHGHGIDAPLFYIPGRHGYGFLPRSLARYLNEGCRIYDALQYPGLNVSEPMPGSIEDIAAHLILQIQRIWPQGPYRLAGYSFGGVMAFEVARQLEARGAEVQLVMLLDSWYPGRGLRKRTFVEIVDHLRRHLSQLNGLERALFFRDWAINKLRFHFRSIKRAVVVKPKEYTTPLMEAARQAIRRYKPGCYGGRVVLFQSEDGKDHSGFRYAPDPTFGWEKLIRGGLEVVSVPGHHISMMEEPAVSKVAERMRGFLKQDASGQTAARPRAGSL